MGGDRTRLAHCVRSGSMAFLVDWGRNSFSARCSAASVRNWFGIGGGVWKKPAVEEDGRG